MRKRESLVAAQGDTARPSHYTSDHSCGYEFDYPGSWEATPLPGDDYQSMCRVQLRPKNFAERMAEFDVDAYTLVVWGRRSAGFLEAANSNGFDWYRGPWSTRGASGARGEATVVDRNAGRD
jgi:hypothetical protein